VPWIGVFQQADSWNNVVDTRATEMTNIAKVKWSGYILAVQPRIRLMRSFDQRQHSYHGYVLRIEGTYGDDSGEFLIAVGKSANEKHQFRVGMKLSGLAMPVPDQRLEIAGFYKTSSITVSKVAEPRISSSPPFNGVPPNLGTYRNRGHRRLDPRTYESKCNTCIWGCRMPVEITEDHWNPSRKRYRFETFCYGPKNCSFYKAGATRKVPGRSGMTWEEEDWVDDDATAHRGLDE